jgi:hypothetical protein
MIVSLAESEGLFALQGTSGHKKFFLHLIQSPMFMSPPRNFPNHKLRHL